MGALLSSPWVYQVLELFVPRALLANAFGEPVFNRPPNMQPGYGGNPYGQPMMGYGQIPGYGNPQYDVNPYFAQPGGVGGPGGGYVPPFGQPNAFGQPNVPWAGPAGPGYPPPPATPPSAGEVMPGSSSSGVVGPPIALLGQQYVTQRETTLIVNERIFTFSGSSFDITDPNGQLWFRVEGHFFSVRGWKSMYDAYGRHVASLTRKILSFYRYQRIMLPTGEEVANVAIKQLFQLRGDAVVNIGRPGWTAPGTEMTPAEAWSIQGSILRHSFDIFARGRKIAQVSQQWMNAKKIVSGKDTYVVTIQPGVDAALISAIVVSLDEIFHPRRSRAGR